MEMDFELGKCDFVEQMTTETCIWTMIKKYGLILKAIIIYYIARQPYISCFLLIYYFILSMFQHVRFTCSLKSHDQLTPIVHVYSILLPITGFSSLISAHIYYTQLRTGRQFSDKIYLPFICANTCLINTLPGSTCLLFRVYFDTYRIFWFTCIDFRNIPVQYFKLTIFTPGFVSENYSEMRSVYICQDDLRRRSAVSVGLSRVMTEAVYGNNSFVLGVFGYFLRFILCTFQQPKWI